LIKNYSKKKRSESRRQMSAGFFVCIIHVLGEHKMFAYCLTYGITGIITNTPNMNRKLLLLAPFLIFTFTAAAQQTHTITASGNSFTPATLTVNVGDQVQFDAGANHPVLQVSQATWDANGTTPLTGGFSFPTGSGTFTPETAGTVYYVCTSHVQLGMKGSITVTLATGINDQTTDRGRLYPVPAIDHIIYESPGNAIIDEIRILDLTGRPVIQMKGLEHPSGQFKIDVSGLNKGMYIIRIRSGESTIIKKFLKS
jgi:plastocyanin